MRVPGKARYYYICLLIFTYRECKTPYVTTLIQGNIGITRTCRGWMPDIFPASALLVDMAYRYATVIKPRGVRFVYGLFELGNWRLTGVSGNFNPVSGIDFHNLEH